MAGPHTLTKFVGKTLQRGLRQPQFLQALPGEADVQGGVRLGIPAFRAGYFPGHAADEFPPGLVVEDLRHEETCVRKSVAPRHESLDVEKVEFYHGPLSTRW